MRKKKTLLLARRIRRFETERTAVLRDLLASRAVLMGSLSLILRRCGKPNCHCARKPAHEVWVLATVHASKRRCQVVRKADINDVASRVEQYKNFRTGLRRLQAIEKAEIQILRGLMESRDVPYE
jgi:hypothetical protein